MSVGDLSGTSGMIFVNLPQRQAMGGPLATEWLESSELCIPTKLSPRGG